MPGQQLKLRIFKNADVWPIIWSSTLTTAVKVMVQVQGGQ